jgi:ribonucleoside-diphosphate reductase beta chain
VAADDALWDVVDERIQELLVPAMGVVTETFERFEHLPEPPFGVDINEMAEYAMDKVGRRLGAIESARGADLRDIDADASPELLEEQFHVEDLSELAAAR